MSQEPDAPQTIAASPQPAEQAQAESPLCKARKQQKILEAAARAFAGQDFHKVRTDDIAAAAGVGKGTLFRYFAGKEELFVATMVYSVEVASAEMDRALAGIYGPQERLETACRQLVDFYQKNECLFQLLHGDKALHDQPRHAEFHARLQQQRDKIAQILRDGQAAGCFRQKFDAAVAARLLFGMMRTAMRVPEFKDRPADEIAGTLLDLFLRGAGKGHAQCRPTAGAPAAPSGEAPPGGVGG
ncbi:MAG TPA: TetR/AcrR family transcriptional regulator [Planctomycetota bacterium]|nr:TetR/AcrR family transcriptional regulator [Planctomycetota bacterium]